MSFCFQSHCKKVHFVPLASWEFLRVREVSVSWGVCGKGQQEAGKNYLLGRTSSQCIPNTL